MNQIKEEAKKLLKKYSLKDTVDLISEVKRLKEKNIQIMLKSKKIINSILILFFFIFL